MLDKSVEVDSLRQCSVNGTPAPRFARAKRLQLCPLPEAISMIDKPPRKVAEIRKQIDAKYGDSAIQKLALLVTTCPPSRPTRNRLTRPPINQTQSAWVNSCPNT